MKTKAWGGGRGGAEKKIGRPSETGWRRRWRKNLGEAREGERLGEGIKWREGWEEIECGGLHRGIEFPYTACLMDSTLFLIRYSTVFVSLKRSAD